MVKPGKFGLFVFLVTFLTSAISQTIPENAKKYAPILKKELISKWPEQKQRSYFAGQVENETCISLKSVKCWSPKAELKTSREYGFGLSQITITDKFNNFDEAKKLDRSLSSWKWENRYDPVYQLRALVLMDKNLYNKLPVVINNRLPFMFSAYNGGYGAVMNDRRLCKGTKDCDPDIWFDNVEKTSFKAKIKTKEYSKSFYEINREYVKNIMLIRYKKYISLMDT